MTGKKKERGEKTVSQNQTGGLAATVNYNSCFTSVAVGYKKQEKAWSLKHNVIQ